MEETEKNGLSVYYTRSGVATYIETGIHYIRLIPSAFCRPLHKCRRNSWQFTHWCIALTLGMTGQNLTLCTTLLYTIDSSTQAVILGKCDREWCLSNTAVMAIYIYIFVSCSRSKSLCLLIDNFGQ